MDPSTKALDWTVTTGETKLALYELQGDDLKIGFGKDGEARPKRLEIGKENVEWLLVLKREREDAKPAPLKEQESGQGTNQSAN